MRGTRDVPGGKGPAVLFTTRTYGNSTAKHISYARGAIAGDVPMFHVQNVRDVQRAAEVRKAYAARVAHDMNLAARARTERNQGAYALSALAIAQEANQCAEFHGWRWRLPIPELSPEAIAKVRAKFKKENAAVIAKRKAREAAALVEIAKRRVAWLAGEPVSGSNLGPDTLLRLWRDGEVVQTSRGAEVPAAHARRLWPIIQRVVSRGEPYIKNGHTEHVGEFTVDRIDVDGTLHVNCHRIPYSELQRMAGVLGLVS